MSDYGMKLVKSGSFEELFMRQSAQNKVYGDMLKMEYDYQTYSFLNMFMVFEKDNKLADNHLINIHLKFLCLYFL